jgi:hypothetical protein
MNIPKLLLSALPQYCFKHSFTWLVVVLKCKGMTWYVRSHEETHRNSGDQVPLAPSLIDWPIRTLGGWSDKYKDMFNPTANSMHYKCCDEKRKPWSLTSFLSEECASKPFVNIAPSQAPVTEPLHAPYFGGSEPSRPSIKIPNREVG